jgi:class 3 adenylate cyclase
MNHGRIADENGDELVLVFPSALDAATCALAVQRELADVADLKLRIGIHSATSAALSGDGSLPWSGSSRSRTSRRIRRSRSTMNGVAAH